jgi:hypothetical protein
MDWIKVLRMPLPTVLVVLGGALAVIAAARGLHWGSFALPQLDTSGRIGLGFLGVLLCSAGFYMYRRGTLPEFTIVRLFQPSQLPGSESWKQFGDKFERNLDCEFAEDPVFELTVENNSSNTLVFYRAGIRLLQRIPRTVSTMGAWTHRTLEVRAALTVRCPDEWKRTRGVPDNTHNRCENDFYPAVEINKGSSHYTFTLELQNFSDTNSASSSEIRFYLVTGNNKPAESRSIWLIQ